MNKCYPWIALIIAGISEVIWAYFMKKSDGLTKVFPSVMFVIILIISMALLTFASNYLPISIAYPVWVGIGAIGSVILGVIFFGESASMMKFFFLALIIAGIIGLKVI
jgi:quaternary ammonium compound-resistance protein SugE